MSEPDTDSASLKCFLAGTLSLRKWTRENLPFLNSQIALDIAIFATSLKLDNQVMAAKSFHLAVGYSADRVREVVSDLVAGGWMLRTAHPRDKRIRFLEASDTLVALMASYERAAREALFDCSARASDESRKSGE